MSVKKEGDLSNGLPPDELSGGGDYQPRPNGLDRAKEIELIDAALLGDMQSFSEIFEHYRSDLHGLCCRRLNDFALAEDAVQDVFIRALKSFPNFDRNRPVWPWFVNVAFKACIDIQRRRSFTHYSEDIGVSVDAGGNGHTESPLDELIASEEREELWKSLDVLPERQRRAFVLYEVDGLSCADIAVAEGISVGAVYRLLFRARKKMRSVHQGGPLPAIVFPFTWLGWKIQRIEERIRPLLSVYGEGLSSVCAQVICLGTLTMMVVVAASLPTQPFDGNNSVSSVGTTQSASQSRTMQTVLQNPTAVVSGKPSVESQQPLAEVTASLADRLINPNQNATPENSGVYSIAVSPNYESDHMILASGSSLERHVLFVSPDGGASWKPQVSRLPLGIQYDTVYSPDFLRDRRIFTAAELGFLQSDDGGEIFKPVSGNLLGWSLAISPSFGRGDFKILMGGKTLFEYDAGTGVIKPVSLAISPGTYPFVTFSPSYPSDLTVFTSDDQTTLHRCNAVCDKVRFPHPGPLKLRFSPQFEEDGLAFAFTSKKVLVSNDGVRTFRDFQFPLRDSGYIYDVAVFWNTPSYPAIFVSTEGSPWLGSGPGIYRSFDGGYSWDGARIDLPGFGYGAKKLIATPTGRLLATGSDYGIACSVNGGQTWAPRCPPEQ